jgi:predicted membrane protein
VGRLVVGLVLVAIGLAWLLEALDVVDVSFLAVLPVALIAVGVAVVAGAGRRRHSGLIALGIVLTLILTVASSFDIRLQGGIGERNVRPATAGEVDREYHLSIGQLTIDLRGLELARGTTRIDASVGLGQLTVRVPEGITVHVHGTAGAGQVTAYGQDRSGLDAELTITTVVVGGISPGGSLQSASQLDLELSVGLGQIEVTR